MITIDVSELESEGSHLSDFLKSRIRVSITFEGSVLVIDSGEEKLSSRDVKAFVKRFLHHRGLSEAYRVVEENEVIRITKRKHKEEQRAKKKETEPLSYDTLPYFFPNRPHLDSTQG